MQNFWGKQSELWGIVKIENELNNILTKAANQSFHAKCQEIRNVVITGDPHRICIYDVIWLRDDAFQLLYS